MIRTPRAAFFVTLLALFLAGAHPASAQVATGTPPFGSFGGGPDVVNLANLNSHIAIPILHKSGRGTNFTYDLNYDSSVWYPVSSGSTTSWNRVSNWGWPAIQSGSPSSGYITYYSTPLNYVCYLLGGGQVHFQQFTNFVYTEYSGLRHILPGQIVAASITPSYYQSQCPGAPATNFSIGGTTTDGAGLNYSVSTTTSQYSVISSATITTPAGTNLIPQIGGSAGAGSSTDRNGNQITSDGVGHYYDTLSGTTPVLTSAGSGTPASPYTVSYAAPSGANAAYTVKYTTYTVQTKFACSGISEYGPTSNNLVSEIDLPDGSKYTFTYEPTPGVAGNVTGRLASVTLPTGGTITYAYSGGGTGVNGITCADGSTSGLTRVLSDGAGWSATWQYDRTAGTGAAYTTTVTAPDAASSKTVIQFQGIYETQRDIYQGTVAAANLLRTVQTCYNGNAANCTSTAITLPISQRKIFTILPNGKQSEHDDLWNTFGAPTETDEYDYGAAPHGPLLKKVLATYAPLGNITAFRQSVTIQDANSNTVSQINYNYDEGTVTATTGTPQHVTPTGARGNLTSTNTYVNATSFLTKSSTYYDTGTLNTSTDVNGAVTTYIYGSGTSCGNSFATSVNLPLSLTQSFTWNCTGGARLTSTDENSKVTTTAYSDPYFWRPASVTDPANAVRTFTYTGLTRTETVLNFNGGASSVDNVVTLDGLGRTILSQTRKGPGATNFDSVETDYDANGRVSRTTLPYLAALGVKAALTAPGQSTTYDAMDRPLTVSDSGGGSTIYSYGATQGNDVLVTRSPAPTSELTKRRQFEYDALGRMTSVCEVTAGTTAWPGGNCAQSNPQTGYWTTYAYNPQDSLTSVTQNAQSTGNTQTRTYAFDRMGRMTQEIVPESGTTRFLYDSDTDATVACTGAYNGDIVKQVDAVGNIICNTYDALHRTLSTTYPSSSPYASVTPNRYFVYDAATIATTPTSTPMVNVKNRLAEAYTCVSPCSSKISDLGFSYTARGETSDIYESTPNSGGYYHASSQYWENGLIKQLTSLVGLPTISYTPDSQGRMYSASASASQNPLSSTTYNAAGLPTAINFGSLDADSFTYDANTNRMTQYQFTVNGQSLTSVLGWNANATLQTQNITNALNTAGTQNCSYQYDDVSRLGSANCGAVWGQTFGYDPFGNLSKSVISGSAGNSFQPTYSVATNRMASLPGNFTPTYDSNGNVLNDSFHTYTWDANGRPHTIDAGLSSAVTLTYDALGRMVEQSRSTGTTQIVFGPGGQKLALYNGQTLQKAFVALAGKSFAAYNSSGLQYYGHADYLGSVRLASTPARADYFDVAYAPFGETYAQSGTLEAAYTGQFQDTAQRQDTAGGLYDFLVREYSTQGRWPSPDPARSEGSFLTDPQTQNRFAYVRNNPMSYTDPTGALIDPLDPFDDGGGGGCDRFFDPFCGGFPCDPFIDPFCFPPGPPTGGGFGPGTPSEKPRTFPWSQLPLFLFGEPGGFVDCGKALAKLTASTARLAKRVAEAEAQRKPDARHLKAIEQATNQVKDDLDRVTKHCGSTVALAAEIALAIAAAEAALAAAEALLAAAAA